MADQIIQLHLASEQFMGFGIETDRGVALTLVNADHKFLIFNAKAKITIKENQRKYSVGDGYAFQSVMGNRMMELSFSVHVQGSGNSANNPAHFTLNEAAGFASQTATVSYRGQVIALPSKCATIQVQEKENVGTAIRGKNHKMKGAAATKVTEHWDGSGQLVQIDYTFIGAYVGTTDLASGGNAVPVLTADSTLPPAVLGATMTWNGISLPTNGITFDYAPKTTLMEDGRDATGYAFANITEFDPVANLKVLIQLEATLAVYAALTNVAPTLAPLIFIVGTGLNQIEVQFPNAQIVKGLEMDARDGIDEQAIMFRAIRNTTAIHGMAVPLVGRFMPLT